MSKIKKPKWDKPDLDEQGKAGFYDNKMPRSFALNIGMRVSVKHQHVRVDVKLNKIVNKKDAEGVITKIHPPSETISDLSVGDCVFIEGQYIEHLNQTGNDI